MVTLTLVVGPLDTNCYILYNDNTKDALVVDPGDKAARILDTVAAYDLKVTAVVLTHAHFDHMLAAGAVCEATGAPLWVGAGDADTITDPRRNLSGMFGKGMAMSLKPDRLLVEGDVLSMGGETLTVLETPGHTPGCICLQGEDLLIAGDTLFAGSIGRLDFPGGDAEAMKRSLARLAALPEELKVYSGHGESTTIGQEKWHNPYLSQI